VHWPEFSIMAEKRMASLTEGVSLGATRVLGPPVEDMVLGWSDFTAMASSREQVMCMGQVEGEAENTLRARRAK
jgi:hypothetical protein